MNVAKDEKVQEALAHWHDVAAQVAASGVEDDIYHQVEMTPIEQSVYFRLRAWAEADGKFSILPQRKVGNYRVDFLLYHNEKPHRHVVIECDGHDFHERTKEQAQRDKKRDRDLQGSGFMVYRFTGSEIWKSSGRCVTEFLDQPTKCHT